ncbi:MAG: hypothetical protein ACKVY0_20760 [Prosthecobacter sp.]|uniref:hypothetical protein n=1 Tax=Prosthecobacter sp. TaxID=1965333 RepID=UPI003900E362
MKTFALPAAVFFCLLSQADARIFTDTAGRKLEAEVVAVQQGQVRIRCADGMEFTLPVTNFSAADQTYLQQWKPPAAAVSGAAPTVPTNAREAAAAKIKELPNGDVLIPDDTLPQMPEAGEDDPQALSLCQFLTKYYAWKADPLEAMKGTEKLDEFEKHEAALKKLMKLAGTRMKKMDKFDFNDMKRELAKGRVVAVIYAHNDLREEAWFEYAKALQADPKLPPPDSKDPALRKKWQEPESASYHSSLIIHGYNTQRDELITRVMGFSSEVYSPRLSIEEMKYITYQVFTFSPE